MNIDLASTDKLLSTTRAVRKRMDFDRPVELSVIEACIDVALQAPSGLGKPSVSELQQYAQFVVVTDESIKERIGAMYQAAHHPHIDHIAELDPEREASGGLDLGRWHTDNIHRAPALVLVCGQIPPFDMTNRGWQVGVMSSIIPAAWSFQLALRARGIGSCWTTIHIIDHEKEMAELLGIPDGFAQFGLIPIGYYTGDDFKPAKRPPGKDVMHINGWQQ